MKQRIIDDELTLIPYFPNEEVALRWYQDPEVCKQVDNIDFLYTPERLRAMYDYLCAHGDCFYIRYRGTLVGDCTLRDNSEIAIVVCREYQNRQIGRRCVRNMIALAKEKGMSQVKANIYSFNRQSRAMFQTLGFIETEPEWFVFRIPGQKTEE